MQRSKVSAEKPKTKAAKTSNKKAGKTVTSKSSKAPAHSSNSEIKKLKTELSSLLSRMDASEINQIVRQAKILLHNRSVIESVRENNAKRAAMNIQDKTKIEVKEAPDRSSFVIVINGARNFFSLDEMRKVVKVCGSASDEADGVSRLYAYLSRNRSDVINDTKINGTADQALYTIYNYLVKNYTVKK